VYQLKVGDDANVNGSLELQYQVATQSSPAWHTISVPGATHDRKNFLSSFMKRKHEH
jgi:hypothetical protein